MGSSYSTFKVQVKYNPTNDLMQYRKYRGYAFLGGNPFVESNYGPFFPDGTAIIYDTCINCIVTEFSIRQTSFFGYQTFALLGSEFPSDSYYTENNKYNIDTNLTDIVTPLCVLDKYPINIYLDNINFGNTNKSDWIYESGNVPCNTLANLPGYDMEGILQNYTAALEYSTIYEFTKRGTKLELKRGFWMSDTDLLNYCLNDITDYSNIRCNNVMFNFCTQNNFENNKCVAWMDGNTKQGSRLGLELYSDYCKSNLFSNACSYFSDASLNYDTSYRDDVIKYYCNNNTDDKNCKCANTKIEYNNTINYYLGPKACWLSSCSINSFDDKYILTEDINTRKNCKLSGCTINIGSLTLSEDSSASIDLINQCKNQSNVTQIVGTNHNDRFEFYETLYINIFIFLIPLFLFIICILFINYYLKNMINRELLSLSIFYKPT